jgi:Fe-S-cluster containining protein
MASGIGDLCVRIEAGGPMAEAISTTIPMHNCKKRPPREEIGSDEILCSYCPAKCCCYFALAIDTPDCWEDFEFIRWYLLHERATVFVEDDSWYLLVHNRCKHLGDDNLCTQYDTRPQVCRDYTTVNCEYEDDWVYDHYWETAEQVEEYAEAVLGPRKGTGFRSPKPV